ncbi:selenide, water dikinase [Brevibacillus choshinensis]|uniref:Selenide, water dikinase n=1 Tax=Brevibacillus choshinensis TaxID=54911 RepID=A0ABR5N7T0_BRECH|nr:selenide, water dikinase SelD [Brevibacillus choshinensis]KQL46656.1 selenide, water dikinase [Brevibacillus choshinensis]
MADRVKLTSLTTKGGCGCKISPDALSAVLKNLPAPAVRDPRLLVGVETSDDAGVFQLNDDLAIVQTLDFFTPIVDDPYWFGQIAAANAISDVFAMGGKPITVLNIVGFPISKLDPSILTDILRGAADKVAEAGAVLVGGHSIDDPEPKFGLAVTGTVHPSRVLTNAGAKPGDVLILTKPIGVGIQTTAIKRDALSVEQTELVMTVMATLNKYAAECMESFPVHACTDVTGFGLLGHTLEMAEGSQAGIRIYANDVPVLPGTRDLAEQGIIPGGSKSNFRWVADRVQFPEDMDELDRLILCDAVTSGGLLISVPAAEGTRLLEELHAQGIEWAKIIGEVVANHPGTIQVNSDKS